ncbi:hypothetical protein OAR04_04455 [Flavobacteriales bacterium]|nr:hypothetical protein [Flavobacteriales bacterium]
MKKLLLILLCLPVIGFGQNVNIPDVNFKAYLVGNSLINTNGDTEIQVSEATAFNGGIICNSLNIFDLTGIEAFTALTLLDCYDNQLTSLDVTANTALNFFICGENQLTSLDVTANTALIFFNCPYNQLTSLDVSQNTILIHLDCIGNELTSLDVNGVDSLNFLFCADNLLECLDVSQNVFLETLECENNVLERLNTKNGNWTNLDVEAEVNSLTCVEVDNIGYAASNWSFDTFTTLSTNCNYTSPCISISSITEQITNRNLIKTINLLGKETKGSMHEPLFYIYDDGTVEKRIVIE